jgi:hypothetical protein
VHFSRNFAMLQHEYDPRFLNVLSAKRVVHMHELRRPKMAMSEFRAEFPQSSVHKDFLYILSFHTQQMMAVDASLHFCDFPILFWAVA